jgi:chromosome segregation ATPase
MITVENLASVKSTIDRLMAQGKQLVDDISETATDRARLLKEAEDREQTIETLNDEIVELRDTVTELESRNNRLVEDMIKLESQLTDATARLETIHETSNNAPPPRNGGTDGTSEISLANLRRPALRHG